MDYYERVKINTMFRTYGKAIRIKAKWIRVFLIVACLIIPFTNWLIPFICLINSDLVRRGD